MELDWSDVVPKKKPTKKQVGLYYAWKKYLTDSRLPKDEIERRAKYNAENNREAPKD